MKTLEERFNAKCHRPKKGCWLWLGARQPTGYGQLWNGERPEQAHRISYRMYCGPIPDELEIHHECHNRSCVNPAHLKLITHRQNILESDTLMGKNARKTECKRGHPLSGKNLRITKNGQRACRLCVNILAANYRRRRRGKS